MGKGRIAGTPIVVDSFRAVPGACGIQFIYFLTHMHTDHVAGLTPTWAHGPIYTSQVTAALMQEKYNLAPGVVRPLEMGVTHVIPLEPTARVCVRVTLMCANHCPGAAMILFKGYFGTYLHTGDFRFHPRMLREPALCRVCKHDPEQALAEVEDVIARMCGGRGGGAAGMVGDAAPAENQHGVGEEALGEEDGGILDAYAAAKSEFLSELLTERIDADCANDTDAMTESAKRAHSSSSVTRWDVALTDVDQGCTRNEHVESSSAPGRPDADLTRGAGIDKIFLDNTFGDPAYVFPEREVGIIRAAEIVRQHPDHIVVLAIDSLGKEEFCLGVARATNEKVWCAEERLRTIQLSGEAPLLEAVDDGTFTTDRSAARLRIMPRHVVTQTVLRKWNDAATRHRAEWASRHIARHAEQGTLQLAGNIEGNGESGGPQTGSVPAFSSSLLTRTASVTVPMTFRTWEACAPVLCILPSGWSCIRDAFDGAHTYSVPYSLHSSYDELLRFMAALRPRSVLGTSNSTLDGFKRLHRMAAPFLDASPLSQPLPRMPAEISRNRGAARHVWRDPRAITAAAPLTAPQAAPGASLPRRHHSWHGVCSVAGPPASREIIGGALRRQGSINCNRGAMRQARNIDVMKISHATTADAMEAVLGKRSTGSGRRLSWFRQEATQCTVHFSHSTARAVGACAGDTPAIVAERVDDEVAAEAADDPVDDATQLAEAVDILLDAAGAAFDDATAADVLVCLVASREGEGDGRLKSPARAYHLPACNRGDQSPSREHTLGTRTCDSPSSARKRARHALVVRSEVEHGSFENTPPSQGWPTKGVDGSQGSAAELSMRDSEAAAGSRATFVAVERPPSSNRTQNSGLFTKLPIAKQSAAGSHMAMLMAVLCDDSESE